MAGNHTIAGHLLFRHAELVAIVFDKHVPFFKRTGVEKHFNSLTRRQLTLCMLRVDAALSATEPRLGALILKRLDDIVHILASPSAGFRRR